MSEHALYDPRNGDQALRVTDLALAPDSQVRGAVIQFHANCSIIETYHAEVGCNGLLFNDPYGVPLLPLDDRPWRRRATSRAEACRRSR